MNNCLQTPYSYSIFVYLDNETLPPFYRLVNSPVARHGAIPWYVSIHADTIDGYLCGGTILSESWILTAARCLEEEYLKAGALIVKAGDYDRNKFERSEQTRVGRSGFWHPQYK